MTQSFATPKYWQQFEDLTQGVARRIFDAPDPEMVGRAGQDQDGLDIVVRTRTEGLVGIQCKRRDERDALNDYKPHKALRLKGVIAAAEAAEAFPRPLGLFILATTAKASHPLQTQVDAYSEARVAMGRFGVRIWAWDTFESVLNRDAQLSSEYYRAVHQGLDPSERDARLLAVFREAFARPAFQDRLNCEHRGNFLHALADTQRALNTGQVVDRAGQPVRSTYGGYHVLSDERLRERMAAVDRSLTSFRNDLLAGEKSGKIDVMADWYVIADFELLKQLEDQRAAIVQMMNEILIGAGLQPLLTT